MTDFLDINHFYLKRRFGHWTLFPFSGKKPTQLGPINMASSILRRVPIHDG
jgi:hypothetical protein